MPRKSKYIPGWKKIFASVGGVQSVLERARVGEVALIPAEDIKNYGDRQSWLGRAIFSRERILGASERVAAHVRALKDVLPEYIHPGEQIECAMSTRGEQLTLRLRLVGADAVPVRRVVRLTPERPLKPRFELEDLGNFYVLVSSFERKIRKFIKERMGKGWVKRLKKELPAIIEKWKERERADINWGIDPEKELINYADISDYISLVERYHRMFTESDEELNLVKSQLRMFANYGRNPIMHCRTLDLRKYYTTEAAISFLQQWIKRIQSKQRAR